jgi:hypothetical protein
MPFINEKYKGTVMVLLNIQEVSLLNMVFRLYGPCLYIFYRILFTGDCPVLRPLLPRTTQTQKNFRHMSLFRVEVEPMIPVFDL